MHLENTAQVQGATENPVTPNEPLTEIEALWIASDIRPNDLENPHWRSATAVSIARLWSGEEAPPERHAEARIFWTDQALHVRFLCGQTEPPVVGSNPKLDVKTIGLWHRDVCEIFIAPDPATPGNYFEFEAAPTGEWLDLGIHLTPQGRETDWEFYSGITTAAQVAGEQLTIAMRIPWSVSIPKPEKGEKWRVNLFRCIGRGNERYLAWKPTHTAEPNFHVPEAFGWLKFV